MTAEERALLGSLPPPDALRAEEAIAKLCGTTESAWHLVEQRFGAHTLVLRLRADDARRAAELPTELALRVERAGGMEWRREWECALLELVGPLRLAPKPFLRLDAPAAVAVEWLPSLVPLRTSGSPRREALRSVARAYRRLHDLPVEPARRALASCLSPSTRAHAAELFEGTHATSAARLSDLLGAIERARRSSPHAPLPPGLCAMLHAPASLPIGAPCLTQLSPKEGNLALTAAGEACFVDWDTARLDSDRERDLACFLALHGSDPADVEAFLSESGPCHRPLIAALLGPVAAWSHLRGGVPVDDARAAHLRELVRWVGRGG